MRRPQLSTPIYWRGRQWAVTRYGVECLTQRYPISKQNLFSHGDPLSEHPAGWIAHMRHKNWVELSDFWQALEYAVRLWPEEMPRKGEDR